MRVCHRILIVWSSRYRVGKKLQSLIDCGHPDKDVQKTFNIATGAQGRELPADKNLRIRLEARRMDEISQE